MVPVGNKATPFVGQPYHRNNSSLSSSSSLSAVGSHSFIVFFLLLALKNNKLKFLSHIKIISINFGCDSFI